MIQSLISKLVRGENLEETEAVEMMRKIMTGNATDAQIAGFITALRMKGETVEEIAGCARVMREYATKVTPGRRPLIDTCGTGGDGSKTFNISTTAAFVVAGCGLAVAKHGNRSISSQCGSADVLEALGVNLNLSPEQVAQCIDEVGIGFLFAPYLHGAMKYAVGPRRELGIRTIFNVLGPLTNPADAEIQLLGVFDPRLTRPLGEVLHRLGVKHALVVHGHGNLDEISLSGPTQVTEVTPAGCRDFTLMPEDLGLDPHPLEEIQGGDPQTNAEICEKVLKGQPGAHRNIVLANAAAALVAAGMAADFRAGVSLAAESIDSGIAYEKLLDLRRMSNLLAAS
mgnify:CR=1 FL=1